ncbi:TM221 protein, partial [Ardeotis kori]|nr:TM221 protein [Ardeotis kori]
IFQLPSGRTGPGTGPPAGRGALPEPAAAVLLPVSAALAALCLVLNSIGVFPVLRPGPGEDTDLSFSPLCCRADWFLLDSRTVRHAAIGLFCCGVSVYLTLAIYMLLLFELEAGIASACILSSGIIVLLITVTHALVRASQVSRRSRSEVSHTLYENDSAQHGESSTSELNNKNMAAPRPEIHREFSFPPFLEQKSQL